MRSAQLSRRHALTRRARPRRTHDDRRRDARISTARGTSSSGESAEIINEFGAPFLSIEIHLVTRKAIEEDELEACRGDRRNGGVLCVGPDRELIAVPEDRYDINPVARHLLHVGVGYIAPEAAVIAEHR